MRVTFSSKALRPHCEQRIEEYNALKESEKTRVNSGSEIRVIYRVSKAIECGAIEITLENDEIGSIIYPLDV